jgi:hypothetical protein
LRFHRSEIVVLLVSSDQPHKKRGRFPRMPLNENWWRLESHWNHEAPTNTRKVSLKLSRHPDDILAYQRCSLMLSRPFLTFDAAKLVASCLKSWDMLQKDSINRCYLTFFPLYSIQSFHKTIIIERI